MRQNEKLSALGLLAAEVAHEIRNPLTVMKMLYHSLDLKFPAGDPRAKDAGIIGQKIDHLNKIVEQILDFARTTEPQFAPVNLNEIVEELCLLVRHKLKNQNIRLVRDLRPRLEEVMGEAGQLEQAFLNLILNAAEAMPEGGTLTITSRLVNEPRHGGPATHIAVDFTDTGHGMSPEQRRRAFSSVLSTTKAKGTGLGLAIVGRVVETHRGELKIKSRVGHGTTVSILLPIGRLAEENTGKKSSVDWKKTSQ
jgi:signal transduction histidine kinase